MNRRQFAIRMAACGGGLILDRSLEAAPRLFDPDSQDDLSPTYAESVQLAGMTVDGKQEISFRVARFPRRGEATLWATACFGDKFYNAAMENLSLGEFKGRTPVEDQQVRFDVTGTDQAQLTRQIMQTRMPNGLLKGSAKVTFGAHQTADPPPGRGSEPLVIEARFESSHPPVKVRPGRSEVMGRIWATVRTPSGVHKFQGFGKWHEQVGERARFASAFTYLGVMGERIGLLAVWLKAGAFGFVRLGDQILAVKTVEFDPIGARRRFRVGLENGRVIEGEAVTRRTISTPIEGRRRPSTTVIVKSDIGPMVGNLNDWEPEKQ
ncbi:MAG: hypothetical protein ACKV2V_20625 [Blastocatellia bacterium]